MCRVLLLLAGLLLFLVSPVAAKAQKGKVYHMYIYYCAANQTSCGLPALTTCPLGVYTPDICKQAKRSQSGPIQYPMDYVATPGVDAIENCLHDMANQWTIFVNAYYTGQNPFYYPFQQQCTDGPPTQ